MPDGFSQFPIVINRPDSPRMVPLSAFPVLVHGTSPDPVQSMISMIFGSPFKVLFKPGAPGSTPVSSTAMTVSRPS